MRNDSNRARRVAGLLKRELATLIQQELKDPRAHGVTVTAAEVAPDLSFAKIYFTVLAGAQAAEKSARALNGATGFLRHELMRRLNLRITPQLRFYYDESVERGATLAGLIDRAIAEDSKRHTQ